MALPPNAGSDGEPIQYVLGTALSLTGPRADLRVSSRAPRNRRETRRLAFDELMPAQSQRTLIVRLGCGSGAIGSRCSSNFANSASNATLVAVDSSRDALRRHPSERRQARSGRRETVHSSWFEALDESLLVAVT